MAVDESKKKLFVLGGVAAVLVVILAWVYWPTPARVNPDDQKALDALNSNKDANPPVPDVPAPTEGPRRKATKGN